MAIRAPYQMINTRTAQIMIWTAISNHHRAIGGRSRATISITRIWADRAAAAAQPRNVAHSIKNVTISSDQAMSMLMAKRNIAFENIIAMIVMPDTAMTI